MAIADAPERWEALGFRVQAGACHVGGVTLRLGAAGHGIVSWAITGLDVPEIDGLSTTPSPDTPRHPVEHPNTAIGVDHIVIVTPDFDRTERALSDLGLELRRVREVPGEPSFRQGFRRLGPAILELVEAHDAPPGPARFWGLVITVQDLDALAKRLGDRLGDPKPAVQPGRRIATLRRQAGLTPRLAFMTSDP